MVVTLRRRPLCEGGSYQARCGTKFCPNRAVFALLERYDFGVTVQAVLYTCKPCYEPLKRPFMLLGEIA